jgi:predicted transcriptional regulator
VQRVGGLRGQTARQEAPQKCADPKDLLASEAKAKLLGKELFFESSPSSARKSRPSGRPLLSGSGRPCCQRFSRLASCWSKKRLGPALAGCRPPMQLRRRRAGDFAMFVRLWMSADPVTLAPGAPIMDAKDLMEGMGFRRIPVVDEGKLVGILTVGILNRIPARDIAMPVERFMQIDPITVDPYQPLDEAVLLMKTHKIGGLPVVSKGKLVGILTESNVFDAVRRIMEAGQQGGELRVLRHAGRARLCAGHRAVHRGLRAHDPELRDASPRRRHEPPHRRDARRGQQSRRVHRGALEKGLPACCTWAVRRRTSSRRADGRPAACRAPRDFGFGLLACGDEAPHVLDPDAAFARSGPAPPLAGRRLVQER